MLLKEYVKLGLGSIVRHLLSFDINLFLFPNACLLVTLLFLLLLLLVLLERFLGCTSLCITVECTHLYLSIWLGHFLFLFAVDWIDC